MIIQLVAIDLDGTLLTADKRLTPRTQAAIERVSRTGVAVVLASARPPRSIQPLYDQCGLRTCQIAYNGALVWDPIAGQILLHKPMEPSIVQRVVAAARQLFPDTLVSLEILDHWYTDRYDATYAGPDRVAEFRPGQPDRIAAIDELLVEPVTKLMLLGPVDQTAELERMIGREFPGQVAIVRNDEFMLQVMHPRAGKSAALRMLIKRLGIPREAVMAIGDAPNDVGMLQLAGLAVAVANADPQVRRVADYVTASNDDDGVAEALEMFMPGN